MHNIQIENTVIHKTLNCKIFSKIDCKERGSHAGKVLPTEDTSLMVTSVLK